MLNHNVSFSIPTRLNTESMTVGVETLEVLEGIFVLSNVTSKITNYERFVK